MIKNISKKIRRTSGRVSSYYIHKIPYDLRIELDLLDESVYWNDWLDWRDEHREFYSECRRSRKQTKQFIQKLNWKIISKFKRNQRVTKYKEFKVLPTNEITKIDYRFNMTNTNSTDIWYQQFCKEHNVKYNFKEKYWDFSNSYLKNNFIYKEYFMGF